MRIRNCLVPIAASGMVIQFLLERENGDYVRTLPDRATNLIARSPALRATICHAAGTIDATFVSFSSRNATAAPSRRQMPRTEFSVIKHGNTRRYVQYRAYANATAIANTGDKVAGGRSARAGKRKKAQCAELNGNIISFRVADKWKPEKNGRVSPTGKLRNGHQAKFHCNIANTIFIYVFFF